jgi:hypothetical protein
VPAVLLVIMIAGVLIGQYLAVPVGLVVYFVYEVARNNKPESVRLETPHVLWWTALVAVLGVLAVLLVELSYSGQLVGIPSNFTSAPNSTTSGYTTAPSTSTASSTSSSTTVSTTVGSTTTIEYNTQSATASTTGFGSGSIFLKGAYSTFICGGASTSTTNTSWKPNVSVSNYSSIGINADGTCTLTNGNIYHQFNSHYAALAGIEMNASNYSAVTASNAMQMFVRINTPGSFMVVLAVGNIYSPGPYLIPTLTIAYPPGASFNCNTTEQQTTPGVRFNSTTFVKSTAAVAVCPNAGSGTYLLSEKNLTDGSFAAYVFTPR